MIVKIGEDSFGAQMKENFLKQGISEEHIITTKEAASGVAPIAVEAKTGYAHSPSLGPIPSNWCSLLT